MTLRSTTEIKRVAPEAMLASIRNGENRQGSVEAAQKLIDDARSYGLDLRDYLRLSVDPRAAEDRNRYLLSADSFMNGYEATLAYLGLPIRDDFDGGVTLQAAADTFQTFPGSRALFPQVVDDMVKWNYRQTDFEKVDPLLAQTRTVAQPEILTTIVNDGQSDYRRVQAVAERGRVPIYSIQATEQTTKFWKFGMGYQTTYEFSRRASLDIMTPYAMRAQKEIERSKVWAATSVLVNGDGVQGAAPVVLQSSFTNAPLIPAATAGTLSYKHICAWLVSRAQAGAPIDTVVGNWDAYLAWLFLFSIPTSNNSRTDAENLAGLGYQIGGVPILSGSVNFVLSSAMPANQLLGLSKSDTLEQTIEAGSLIAESEKSIKTQEVTYIRTENSGFRLVFGDTRSIYDYSA
jgi:hypothetical protein